MTDYRPGADWSSVSK